MNILLTGGYGFLGEYVYSRLNSSSHVLDGDLVKSHTVTRFHSQQYNLEDSGDVQRIFAKVRPDVVIHLAAKVGGIGSNQKNPATYFYSNMMMGLNIIEACRDFGVSKLVNICSACSYPSHAPVPFKEEDIWLGYPESTNSAYGIAKRAMLTLADAYRQQYGQKTVSLILTNLYGPGEKMDETAHATGSIIRKLQNAKDAEHNRVILWGSGYPTRDYLYVEDAAEAIVRASEICDGSLPVNLGSGQEVSIRRLAELVADALGYWGEIVWDESMPDGQARRLLDTSRAERLFGWKAKTPFEVGIKNTIDWAKLQKAVTC